MGGRGRGAACSLCVVATRVLGRIAVLLAVAGVVSRPAPGARAVM